MAEGARKFCGMLLLAWVAGAAAVELDPVFNQGSGTELFSEHAQALPDGRILVCGKFMTYNDEPAPSLIRLNEDGSIDRTFRHSIGSWVRNFVVQPDGKIIAGGAFTGVNGQPHGLIVRLHPDGALDDSFETRGGFTEKLVPADPNPPYVFWIALQPDGKAIVTGSFAKYAGRTVNGIVRLNPDGSIDETFQSGKGLDSWGRFVRVQSNGQILLAGWFTSYNGYPCSRLLRLNSDGTPDPYFRPKFGDKTAVYSAAPLADGKYIVTGHSKGTTFTNGVARLNADGSLDPAFAAFTNERTECVLVQPDGKILVSGWFTVANNQPRGCIARFNADGALDDTFVANSEGFIWHLAFDQRGRILASGSFPHISGHPRRGIARLIEFREPPAAPLMLHPRFNQDGFEVSTASETGRSYCLEYCDTVDGPWKSLAPVAGTGQPVSLRDSTMATQRLYRLRVE